MQVLQEEVRTWSREISCPCGEVFGRDERARMASLSENVPPLRERASRAPRDWRTRAWRRPDALRRPGGVAYVTPPSPASRRPPYLQNVKRPTLTRRPT